VTHYIPNTPILLVGNKKDLREDQATIRSLAARKQVPLRREQGNAVAAQISAIAYVECSAKTMEARGHY
jgi:GTPase SAR1 family protein